VYARQQGTLEAGQSTTDDLSKSVLGEFDSCVSHFLFLVAFVSLDARKQCCDRLGVE
jgi:hypothetical protein